MASIHPHTTKSGSRRWVVRYRDPMGGSREKWFDTKAEAVRHGTAQEARVHSGQWVDPARCRISLESWVETWRGTMVGLKPKTRDSYESLLRSRILPALGGMSLADIRPSGIKAWMAQMEAHGLSGSRITQAVNLLSRILGDAVLDENIARNPCSGIRRPGPRRAEITPLRPEEVSSLIDAADPRYTALIATLAYAGMRFGEACALRWKHVNLMLAELTVSESLSVSSQGIEFGPTKTHAVRRIAIPRVLRAHLERHLAKSRANSPEDLVFTSPGGKAVRHSNFSRRVWRPAVTAIGRPNLRIHDLRHTCASLLIHAGASLVNIADHLGHENPTTTLKHYGHLLPGSREAIAKKLDEVVASTIPS